MATIKDLSVLIAHASVDESSRLTSVLDNSGYRIRAKQISSRAELAEEIKTSKIDIILAQQDLDDPSPVELMQDLNRLNRDVPVILINNVLDGALIAQGIRIGARDVVAIDDDQHLVAVVNRELKNRMDRYNHRETLRRFYASENRYQQLLQYARLPMAIVHESMFVLINDAFSELFEIDVGDAEALPIVDILDKEAQLEYKEVFKKFQKAPEGFPGAELKTYKTSADGEQICIQIDLNAVKYNEEDCLQLKVEPQLGKAISGSEISANSGLTVPRNKLIQHIESCISIAHQQKKDSTLLCLEIDAFEQIQESLGIGATDQMYSTFLEFAINAFEGNVISLLDNNKLMVLIEATDGDVALKRASDFCQTVDSKVFEFGENSQQFTVTIGCALISDLSTNADGAVRQSIRACEQLLSTRDNAIGNGAHLYEPEKSESVDADINFLLKQAFKHSHLQVLFQPMMKFHGEARKSYEVLLGIRPDHKETYPNDFIAQATRNNENGDIDRWVILEAMKTLLKKLNCVGDEQLYIHVSKQSLQNPKFAGWVMAAIKKSRLNPKQISFQLREVDVASNLNAAATFMKALRSLGCSSVITNFGSSVQPMKILEQIPFDFAKVDGSFTLEAQKGNPENLSKTLEQLTEKNIKAIVPMVESATILPTLWKSNVAYIQGYYVQAPSDKMDYKF